MRLLLSFHSEILPDNQPSVGHGERGEVGGRPSGIKIPLVMFINMSLEEIVP